MLRCVAFPVFPWPAITRALAHPHRSCAICMLQAATGLHSIVNQHNCSFNKAYLVSVLAQGQEWQRLKGCRDRVTTSPACICRCRGVRSALHSAYRGHQVAFVSPHSIKHSSRACSARQQAPQARDGEHPSAGRRRGLRGPR